jgi:hypothetical protein
MQVGRGVQATYFYVITIDQLYLLCFTIAIPLFDSFFFLGPIFRQHNLILGSDRRIRSQKRKGEKTPPD